MQAQAPSWLSFPHLKEHRGPQVRHLHQVCGWIRSHCSRLIEGHPSWGPGPVYSRGSKTEMVLWPENRCHRIEAWQSCPSQGRCFSRKRKIKDRWEDKPHVVVHQIVRHPLLQSEEPVWIFTCPTSQLAPPHCIRSWYSLACGCLPSMGQLYQSHPSQAYSQREWQQNNIKRRWCSGDHPASG